MADAELMVATEVSSPLGEIDYERAPFRVGAVQEAWHLDPDAHREALARGIRLAAEQGAKLVCLQELTLSPYFAISPDNVVEPEELESGPTHEFAAGMARATGACRRRCTSARRTRRVPDSSRTRRRAA